MTSVGRVSSSLPLEQDLFKYASQGRTKKTQRIFESEITIPIDLTNSKGQTLLYVSCLYGHHKLASLLLKKGSDPNKRAEDGSTPTHAAAYSCSAEVLELIVTEGGDLRLHDVLSRTPKDWALAAGRKAGKKVLHLIKQWQHNIDQEIEMSYKTSTENRVRSTSSLQGSKETEGATNKALCQGYGRFVRMLSGSSSTNDIGLAAMVPLASPAQFTSPDNEPTVMYRSPPSFLMEGALWCGHKVTIKRRRIKDFDTSLRADEDLLITEANANSHLRHPHLLLLMSVCLTSSSDSYTCSPLHWLVYEPVSIGCLHHILHRKHSTILLTNAIRYMVQIGNALMYMHERGFVHCAVSSHAIHLTSSDTAKLGDLSYVCHAAEKAKPSNQIAFTLNRWLAPEVILHKSVCSATDMYSYCLVVCEIISGVLPWTGYDCDSIKDHVAAKHNYASIPDSVPEVLRPILAKGMKSASHKRLIAIKDVSYALRALCLSEKFKEIETSVHEQNSKSRRQVPKVGSLIHSSQDIIGPNAEFYHTAYPKLTATDCSTSSNSGKAIDVPDSVPCDTQQIPPVYSVDHFSPPVPNHTFHNLPFNRFENYSDSTNIAHPTHSQNITEPQRSSLSALQSTKNNFYMNGRSSAPILGVNRAEHRSFPVAPRITAPGPYFSSSVLPYSCSSNLVNNCNRNQPCGSRQMTELGTNSPSNYMQVRIHDTLGSNHVSSSNLTDDDKGSCADIPSQIVKERPRSLPSVNVVRSSPLACDTRQQLLKNETISNENQRLISGNLCASLPPKPLTRRMINVKSEVTTPKYPTSDQQSVAKVDPQGRETAEASSPVTLVNRDINVAANHQPIHAVDPNLDLSPLQLSVDQVRQSLMELSSMFQKQALGLSFSNPEYQSLRPKSCSVLVDKCSQVVNNNLSVKRDGSLESNNISGPKQDVGISRKTADGQNPSYSSDYPHFRTEAFSSQRSPRVRDYASHSFDSTQNRCKIQEVNDFHNRNSVSAPNFEDEVPCSGPDSIVLTGAEVLQSSSPPDVRYELDRYEESDEGIISKYDRNLSFKRQSNHNMNYPRGGYLDDYGCESHIGQYTGSVCDQTMKFTQSRYHDGPMSYERAISRTRVPVEENRHSVSKLNKVSDYENAGHVTDGIGDMSMDIAVNKLPNCQDDVNGLIQKVEYNDNKTEIPQPSAHSSQMRFPMQDDGDSEYDCCYLASASDNEVAEILQKSQSEHKKRYSIGSEDLEEIFSDFADRRLLIRSNFPPKERESEYSVFDTLPCDNCNQGDEVDGIRHMNNKMGKKFNYTQQNEMYSRSAPEIYYVPDSFEDAVPYEMNCLPRQALANTNLQQNKLDSDPFSTAYRPDSIQENGQTYVKTFRKTSELLNIIPDTHENAFNRMRETACQTQLPDCYQNANIITHYSCDQYNLHPREGRIEQTDGEFNNLASKFQNSDNINGKHPSSPRSFDNRKILYNKHSQTCFLDSSRSDSSQQDERSISKHFFEEKSSLSSNFVTCHEDAELSKMKEVKMYSSVGTSPMSSGEIARIEGNQSEEVSGNLRYAHIPKEDPFLKLSDAANINNSMQLISAGTQTNINIGYIDEQSSSQGMENQACQTTGPMELDVNRNAMSKVDKCTGTNVTPSKWTFQKKLTLFEEVSAGSNGCEPHSLRCLLSKEKKSSYEKLIDRESEIDSTGAVETEHERDDCLDSKSIQNNNKAEENMAVTPKTSLPTWIKDKDGMKTSTPLTQSELLSKICQDAGKGKDEIRAIPSRSATLRNGIDPCSSPILQFEKRLERFTNCDKNNCSSIVNAAKSDGDNPSLPRYETPNILCKEENCEIHNRARTTLVQKLKMSCHDQGITEDQESTSHLDGEPKQDGYRGHTMPNENVKIAPSPRIRKFNPSPVRGVERILSANNSLSKMAGSYLEQETEVDSLPAITNDVDIQNPNTEKIVSKSVAKVAVHLTENTRLEDSDSQSLSMVEVLKTGSYSNSFDLVDDENGGYEVADKYMEEGIDALAEEIVDNEISHSLQYACKEEFDRLFAESKCKNLGYAYSNDSGTSSHSKVVLPGESMEEGQDFTSLMVDSEDCIHRPMNSVGTSVWSMSMQQNSEESTSL